MLIQRSETSPLPVCSPAIAPSIDDALNTSFKEAHSPHQNAPSEAVIPAQSSLSAEDGILPILGRFGDNCVADIKFVTKTIARGCALGAAYFAYAQLPHFALGAALINIGLAFVSDLCERELRERYERRMEDLIQNRSSPP